MNWKLVGLLGVLGLMSATGAWAAEAEKCLIHEGNAIWVMDTNGHRVSQMPLGDAFGMRPILYFDPGYEVIWAVGGGKFGVFDLRAKPLKAEILVEGVSRGVVNLEVALMDWKESVSGSALESQYGQSMFSFVAMGELAQTRIYPVRMGEDAAATQRLKWVGETWLKANSVRAKKDKVEGVRPFSKKGVVDLPMTFQNCSEGGWCGRASAFGSSALQLVVTEAECNDGCYVGCHVRNKRGEMSQPPDLRSFGNEKTTAGSCRDYFFAKNGMHFATRTELCVLAKDNGVQCKRAPGVVLGWIDGVTLLAP